MRYGEQIKCFVDIRIQFGIYAFKIITYIQVHQMERLKKWSYDGSIYKECGKYMDSYQIHCIEIVDKLLYVLTEYGVIVNWFRYDEHKKIIIVGCDDGIVKILNVNWFIMNMFICFMSLIRSMNLRVAL